MNMGQKTIDPIDVRGEATTGLKSIAEQNEDLLYAHQVGDFASIIALNREAGERAFAGERH